MPIRQYRAILRSNHCEQSQSNCSRLRLSSSCSSWLQLVAACLFGLVPLASVHAQSPSAATVGQPANSLTSPATDSNHTGLSLDGIKLAPFSRPTPGSLLTLRVQVSNASGQLQSALVLARIDQRPDLQAAAEIHVPAGSNRTVDLRLQLPGTLAADSRFEVSVSVNSLEAGQRVLLSVKDQPIIDSLMLRVDSDKVVTAAILEHEPAPAPEWFWPTPPPSMPYELTIAARVDAELSRRTLSIGHDALPTQMADWAGLNAIVIARDDPLRDAAFATSMSQWLASGGRLWIMLDRVSDRYLQEFLTDGQSCKTIDDIELNEFVVDTNFAMPISIEDRTIAVEQPLHLRRVVQTGGTVSHLIDGFPAAVWFDVGKGRVLVTTLEARAWVKPRESKRSQDPTQDSNFQMRNWAQNLADQFYASRDAVSPLQSAGSPVQNAASPVQKAEIEYPIKHIGNPIPDRRFVMAVLFTFGGLLCIAGLICWKTSRMVQLGWIIPVISIGACVPILVAAQRLRRDLVDTSAHLQVIEVLPGSRVIAGTQWTTSYLAGSNSSSLFADGDATVRWPTAGQQLDLRRWLWTDYQRWQLSSSGWPHGIWRIDAQFNLPPRPLDVIARVDQSGLNIELPKEMGETLQDAVLYYTPGDAAICRDVPLGRSVGVPDDQLTLQSSWLGDSIVSDEQSRRGDVYRHLFTSDSEHRFPSYPALLGWTDLWPSPIKWDGEREERGAALVILPVKLLPVPSGTSVYVPHTLISVETPLIGQSRSNAYSNSTGRWRGETTLAMSVPIRFQLPPQVCPIEVSEIVCELQLRAPQRQVTVTSSSAKASGPIAVLRSPLAAQRFRITDPAILDDARDGAFDLTIDVSDRIDRSTDEFGSQVGPWQIDYFRVSARGQVAER